MSHIPERKEKDCLNCGTVVQGKFCQNCGQENVVPKETFWHMVTHFFYDITHFDSNFFSTIHHLVLKPGFLSQEYMKGRRANYLHPIKMYVFTSAIFFLIFFTFSGPKQTLKTDADKPASASERAEYVKTLQDKLEKDTGNVVLKTKLTNAMDTSRAVTVNDFNEEVEKNNGVIYFGDRNYKNVREYDSMERTLPPAERDGWFVRRLKKKEIEINDKYRENPDEASKKFGNILLHKLPYMLFISLPLFALILRLVYIRRKQFYFADHGVFTIHLYIFTFLLMLLVFALNELEDWMHTGFIGIPIAGLFIWLFIYLYKAMRNFYGQRRWKTFVKFLLVAFFSFLMMMILFLFFVFFSAFTL